MTNELKEFTVDRPAWYRGHADGSQLRRTAGGQMCCLGFYGLACGLAKDDITRVGSPDGLSGVALRVGFPDWMYATSKRLRNSEAAHQLMSCNDSTEIDDATREERLTELFAAQGVKVKFIN